MLKYIGGICAIVLVCVAFFLTASCVEGNAKILSNKNEFVVGKDIAITEIKDFYYTIDASTNPPVFQRYRFTSKNGKYTFYHEKREGDTWPLTEKYITVSGTTELSDVQWRDFFNCIDNGKVTERIDDAKSGKRGPWLYIYWENDKGIYQVFEFATHGQRKAFEKFVLRLMDIK